MKSPPASVRSEQPAGHGDEPARTGDRPSLAKRLATAMALGALGFSALVGGNAFGTRDRLFGVDVREARPPAAGRVVGGTTVTTAPDSTTLVRSYPWWQGVTSLEGAGTTQVPTFEVGDDAIQWRVRATCTTGRVVVVDPSGRRPVLDAPCRGEPSDYGISSRTGPKNLRVVAEGPWRLEVDQQVDVPLEEPPLPEMTAPGTTVVATGDFYRMDQHGEGTITVYRLGDGRHALRLDKFFVTANIDLEIRLHPLEAPRTTADYLSAPAALAAPLPITAGSLNFVLPEDLAPTAYRSVVIWCPIIASAYAGATLRPVA
ncbi:MAG TPA: DM13 domain-containing protein [Acidimicrobiales bacterium]|jgi:hypothetical protein|nr:DM13 domain-containing protein [Acidimicrobiales bacterium]